MGVVMAEPESRLSRWSRLKSKGGADAREEATALEDKARVEIATQETPEDFLKLPGGARVRHFAPAMTPLAPEAEEGDDDLTRGIGHLADDTDPETAALIADAAAGSDEDIFAGIEEEELDDEQQQIADDLPPLASLNAESDFTPFFKEGVPEFIKRRAMRVLWRAIPFFNFRDGLNEYDEDYNIIHKTISEFASSYKVGRGHLSEQELQDMMPEEARRAFDEDDADQDDEEIVDAEAGEELETVSDEDDEDPENARKKADLEEIETAADEDEIGDGEDDPNA